MQPSANPILVVTLRLLLLLIAIGLWQFLPSSVLDEFLWSRPLDVLAQMSSWIMDGTLLWNAADTLVTVGLGLVLGGAVGVALGLLAGFSIVTERLLLGPVQMLFALPKITLVPLFILWLGVGTQQHIVFTAVVVFFFFFFAIFNGVRDIASVHHSNFELFGASPWQMCRLLVLPACRGWIALSLRLAVPYAFVSAVSAEVVASTSGLGHLVKTSASVMNASGMFAALIVLLIVSLACSLTINRYASNWARFD